MLVLGGATVKLWDVGQRSCMRDDERPGGGCVGVCFAPGGGKVASVSDDKSVNLYDFV